ncbi:Late embryogenesis abundant protein [Macleaya cordata]|uniref:Late embryogenesis abundant protein n=1 Tax=Macleaya cordata TaxID=56857 RepID=A0A200RDS5_MACCD|nr:Late embryogenesis abundant protein [Macleaya cordata]
MSHHHENNPHFLQAQQQQPHQQEHQNQQHPLRDPYLHKHDLKVPHPRRTKPTTWFLAFFCVILWVIIILGGLAVLIVYLVFRPKNPRFDIPNATLNAVYLDTGSLLNSDLTILANFTNPNKKVSIDYSYIVIELYYGNTLIATTSVDPFSETSAESNLQGIHLVSSEVSLSSNDIQRLKKEVGNNSVMFDVQGRFRTRSNFGSFLHYSYWLHGRCSIVLTGPPYGVLVSHKCKTKR